MINRKAALRPLLMTSASFAIAMTAFNPAFAQIATPVSASPEAAAEGADQSKDIIVTGTRIQRPDLTTASPVNVIGQEEIKLRSPTTAEELLRDLPSVRPALGPAVNNGGNGAATVDLRGLGANRTLVLLDGKRVVPFSLAGQVDVDNIPVALVQRVDVVTGGASSVYGADAVAGVVNFILKKDFQGVDMQASYRVTQRGDAPTFKTDLTVGGNFAEGKGNAVFSMGYTKRKSLVVTDRDIARISQSSANGLLSGSTTAVPLIITSPGNVALGLTAGSFGAIIDPTTGAFRTATQGDTYNSNVGTFFQTPLETYRFYGSAHYEVAPNIDVYANGLFSRNSSNIQLASSGSFLLNYAVPLSNAYLPVAARNQLCAANNINAASCALAAATTSTTSPNYREVTVTAGRRFTEYGPRGGPVDFTTFQVQGGVRGDITSTLKFDVSAQYGETNVNTSRDNWGSYSRLQQALRSYTNAAGQPVCYDTSNSCVAFNLFGPEGSITQSQLGFIDLDARTRTIVNQEVIDGGISGDVFGLKSPLADKGLAFSLGAQYRRMSAQNLPDLATRTQNEVLGSGAPTPPDSGHFDVKEVFGELIAPLIEDKPWMYRAQAEGGVRYSNYSTTGTSTTWKAGGEIEPIKGFKLRGMYQVAVRSPSLSELYTTQTIGLSNFTTDPCQQALPVGNAALTALCVATGAPAGVIGSIPTPSAGQINVTSGGNPLLQPEEANTYTLGGVFQPSFIPGFALTIDYYHIKIKNTISSIGSGDVLNGCFSAALNPGYSFNAFCSLVKRSPVNGSLNGGAETPGVIAASANLGNTLTAGIDLGATYSFPLERIGLMNAGKFNFGFNGTWLQKYYSQSTPNSINRDCTGYYSTNCTNPRPRYKWNMRTTYSLGPLDVSLLWTHISKVKLEPYLATQITPLTTPQPGGPNPTATTFGTVVIGGVTYTNVPLNGILAPYRQIKAYDYFDLSFNVEPAPQMNVTFTVDNLFNRQPPAVGNGVGGTAFNNGNTFPTTYDVLGRTFTISAEFKF